MKVILIKDVARLGRKSEVKDVPSGHALNFLIPRKFAVIATDEQLKRIGEEEKQHGAQKEHAQKVFMDACAVLAEKRIRYPAPANEKGHLFKGINADDIQKYLESTEHIVLQKQVILLAHPIKELGIHEIPLSFGGGKGMCTLEVVKK